MRGVRRVRRVRRVRCERGEVGWIRWKIVKESPSALDGCKFLVLLFGEHWRLP